MSTIPPPPPPPFGYTSTQSRSDSQVWKAQRRAAAQQARWQRSQWRMQMRAARRTSLVGPLLLVVLGVVLLLLETGHLHWSSALDWLGRWWPAVLIVAGLVMVGEWVLDRNQVTLIGSPSIHRRALGGVAAALLILLALLGAGVMAANHGSAWADRNLDEPFVRRGIGDWHKAFGAHSETVQELQAGLSDTGSLTIANPRGNIQVTGSSQDGQVHVSAHQHLYVWQRDEIDGRQHSEQPRFEGNRTNLLLTAAPQEQDDADLIVVLPHTASLTVHGGHGDITIEELRGPVTIDAVSGDVKLTALGGTVHLQTHDDDATVTAHSLGNGLTLEGRTGDINLTDVLGPVGLHGDFFGTTHLERIKGEVRFQSSFTNFACLGIPGELNIEGRSDLDAHHLNGPVTLSTTNRNLTLDGVRGGVAIEDRNGSVNLTLAGSLQPVRVSNANGSLEVAVSAERGFNLQAKTHNGQIANDFGLAAHTAGENSELQAQVKGGGPTLNLQTTEGDITVRRTEGEDASDWTDATEHITPAPSLPSPLPKHLKPKRPATKPAEASPIGAPQA